MKHVALDTETTGVEPGSRLIEIAAQVFDETGPLDTFQRLINPGMPLPPDAVKANGITNDMLAGAQDAGSTLTEFFEWLPADAVLVIHNAPFDCGIITWELGRFGLPMPILTIIDTLVMARGLKETKRNGLAALIEYYGIERSGDAHRALSDADACRQYFCRVKDNINHWPTRWEEVGFEHSYTDDLPEALAELPNLIASGDPLHFKYRDAKEEETERTITPYGWAQMPGSVWLHGFCHMREARRTFRADRVIEVRKENDTATTETA